MLTLEKIAGYDSGYDLVDKVAEAMDYLEENGIDPIGGLTALMNIDPEGRPLDEKVANEINQLSPAEIQVLNEVGQFLAGEDPQEIAKVALELDAQADVVEKVAEAMDYLEANGIEPEAALIIAANVTPEGYIADPQIEEKVAAEGFTDYDFQKIAEAVDFLAQNGISLDEAYQTMALIKEAAAGERTLLQRAREGLKNYWDAIRGAGAKEIKQIAEAQTNPQARARAEGVLAQIRLRQAKALGGTALGVGALGGGAYAAHRALSSRKRRS